MPAIKSPVIRAEVLFVAHGYDVGMYIIEYGSQIQFPILRFQDYFPFPDPVESIEEVEKGVLVETTRGRFLIAGGPAPATYYVTTLYFFNLQRGE